MDIHLITLTTDSEAVIDGVFDYIKQVFPNWARLSKSVFIVKSDIMDTSTIRDILKPFIKSYGKLFVIEITDSSWASYRTNSDILNWLRK